ncbi:MAG: MerR family transcriptional regulator, partial [Bacteroidetes bacterium]|nr:MerR family transcriptional regulator [Bacteroidota bacterium]
MPRESYSINEVSELCGVNVWTLRFWTDRFEMIKP